MQRSKGKNERCSGVQVGCDWAAWREQPLQWWPLHVESAEEHMTTTTKDDECPPHVMTVPGPVLDSIRLTDLQDISELTCWECKSSETLTELFT